MQAKRGARKLVDDRRFDGRIVARVGRQGVVAHQRRQPFVVGDRLNLADDDLPSALVKLLVGPGRMFLGQQGRLVVMLAHKQRRQIRQLDILVGPDVSGGEQSVLGNADVVGHVEAHRVVRQQVAGAGLELSAAERPQGGGGRGSEP